MVFFLWDIDKQSNPRCDAAKRGVPSGAILFPFMNLIERCNKKRMAPVVPKNESGLFQMIGMGKPICHI